MTMIWNPSPNFGERSLPITMLVLHYTGMQSGAAAIDWLANPASKVSAHYVVDEDGQLVHMVREEQRAQHAGLSYWRGVTDCNSASIGIEIVNPGHEFGYRPFPEAQMDTVTRLVAELVRTYGIDQRNVVGHSDVAPTRKEDPGELFDWERLAKLGCAVPRPRASLVDPGWPDAAFFLALDFEFRQCSTNASDFIQVQGQCLYFSILDNTLTPDPHIAHTSPVRVHERANRVKYW
jgi:N-acetylmuramoyl-L-alanine amidase